MLWLTTLLFWSCTFLLNVKIEMRRLVCYHPDLNLPSFHVTLRLKVTDCEVWYSETATQQETLQPVALCTLCGSVSTCRQLHCTLSPPLPIEVNAGVIFSLFHWSLVPRGAVELAFSLKVNFIWTAPALVLACCFSVLRPCLYWLHWNEIMPHFKERLSPVGHS